MRLVAALIQPATMPNRRSAKERLRRTNSSDSAILLAIELGEIHSGPLVLHVDSEGRITSWNLSEGRAEDERWHLRKDGERFWALGVVSPTHEATGQQAGCSKILRDMTYRKRAEEAIQLADRRKDEFLATLAHELRSPMAPLRNGLQLLKLTSNQEKTEEARSMMEGPLGLM